MCKWLKNIQSFSSRQVQHIGEEGVSAFYRKIKKILKLSCLKFLAPAAVHFNLDWPEAYYAEGTRIRKRYKKILSQAAHADEVLMQEIEKKIIHCFQKYTAYKPDLENFSEWMEVNRNLYNIFATKDLYKENIDILHRVKEARRRLLKEYQLDRLDIEFVDRSFAFGSIGVYERLEVYVKAGLLGLRPPKRLILLLDPKSPVNNACYLDYWRSHIEIISDPKSIRILTSLEKYLTVPFKFIMPFYEKTLVSHRALGMVREQWIQAKWPPVLTLSNEDYTRGWDCLRSLGVPDGAWFVCLHVREAGYNDNNFSESFRNAKIGTYSLAIKAVVDAGGWVIRIGDPSMTLLPKMPQVIDYAHSEAKSDWMDVFLCAQCRFFIGTSSGMFGLALAFGVPIMMTNFLPGQALYYFTSKDIIIPRLCRSKRGHRILSFREMVFPPIGMLATQARYEKFGIEVIENSPEEIRDAVQEMLARFDGPPIYSEEDENLQERFRVMTGTCGEFYGDKDVVVHARIGRNFLRKHAALLPAKGGELEKQAQGSSC